MTRRDDIYNTREVIKRLLWTDDELYALEKLQAKKGTKTERGSRNS